MLFAGTCSPGLEAVVVAAGAELDAAAALLAAMTCSHVGSLAA